MEQYEGIDLASDEHRLCLVDGESRQLEQRRIGHDLQPPDIIFHLGDQRIILGIKFLLHQLHPGH